MATFRKNFGRIKKIVEIPNLIEIQKKSYARFLQRETDPSSRGNFGLQGAFRSVFPIEDFGSKCSLEFVSYAIGEARYDEQECIQKGMTYAAPLKIVVRLVVFETDRASGQKSVRDIKEQEIYFGEIPLMTDKEPSSSTAPSGSSSASFTGPRESLSSTTRAGPIPVGNSSIPPGSCPSGARGWTSSSIQRTSSTPGSTGGKKCP